MGFDGFVGIHSHGVGTQGAEGLGHVADDRTTLGVLINGIALMVVCCCSVGRTCCLV